MASSDVALSYAASDGLLSTLLHVVRAVGGFGVSGRDVIGCAQVWCGVCSTLYPSNSRISRALRDCPATSSCHRNYVLFLGERDRARGRTGGQCHPRDKLHAR
jgi:hypothetical protein